jgi:hypothetical protein
MPVSEMLRIRKAVIQKTGSGLSGSPRWIQTSAAFA